MKTSKREHYFVIYFEEQNNKQTNERNQTTVTGNSKYFFCFNFILSLSFSVVVFCSSVSVWFRILNVKGRYVLCWDINSLSTSLLYSIISVLLNMAVSIGCVEIAIFSCSKFNIFHSWLGFFFPLFYSVSVSIFNFKHYFCCYCYYLYLSPF